LKNVNKMIEYLLLKGQEALNSARTFLQERMQKINCKKFSRREWILTVLGLGVAGYAGLKGCEARQQAERLSLLEKKVRQFEKSNGKNEDSFFVLYYDDIKVNGGTKDFKFTIPTSAYRSYKKMTHKARSNSELVDFVLWEDPSVKYIADYISSSCSSRKQAAQALLDLTSQNVYDQRSEPKGGDYIRYPVETMIERNGDCEDTAILYAALLKAAGFDTVLLRFPGQNGESGHWAVGVRGDFEGTYYKHKGKKYYYAETTGITWIRSKEQRWQIGQIPEEFKGKSAEVYHVK